VANELLLNYAGTPAHGLYAVVRQLSNGYAWNGSAFEPWADAHLGTYAIALSDLGGDLFAAGIAAGDYFTDYYDKAGSSPSTSDLLIPGETYHWNGSAIVPGSPTYTGRYTDSEAVRTWLGTINADAMADLDGDDAPDAGAYQQSIQWGEDELDLYAGGGPGAVPFPYTGGTTGQQAVAQRTIGRWATVLSGWQLAYKRPAVQGNLLATPAAAQALATLDGAKRAVLDEIKQWRAGGLLLPGLTPATEAEDTPEPGQFQFVAIDRGNGCNGDENSSCW
jgi:hypothetical protein